MPTILYGAIDLYLTLMIKNRNGATGTYQVVFEPTVGIFNNKG
jgi:replicative DNA helicase